MIVRLLFAALLGGVVGGAELVARYRDRPCTAVLSPSGLLYVFVNASASMLALVTVEALGWRFGLPEGAPSASEYVVQVMAGGLGAALLFRASFTLAQDKGISFGPIAVLHGMLKIVDSAMERKRALSRLSHNDLAGLSFVRDHAALAELCCHALQRFDLAEAQRLGELAADLGAREDLTDADKLDCFGLELSRLVGERALRKAADRLRDRSAMTEAAYEQREQGYGEHYPEQYGGYGPQAVGDGMSGQMAQVPRVTPVQDSLDEASGRREEARAPLPIAVGGGQEPRGGASAMSSPRSSGDSLARSPGGPAGGTHDLDGDRTLRFKAPPGSGRLTRRSIRDS